MKNFADSRKPIVNSRDLNQVLFFVVVLSFNFFSPMVAMSLAAPLPLHATVHQHA